MEKFVLKHPVTVGERTVTELSLQDPKVRHLRRTDGHDINSIASDVALLSALSGEPELVIDQIDLKDWAVLRIHLQRIYLEFFGIDPDKTPQNKGEPEDPQNPEAQ